MCEMKQRSLVKTGDISIYVTSANVTLRNAATMKSVLELAQRGWLLLVQMTFTPWPIFGAWRLIGTWLLLVQDLLVKELIILIVM